MTLTHYSSAELKENNGKNGKPVWIAFEGKIYDVSTSFTWRTGMHQVVHHAGTDLSGELSKAPHGTDLLEKFPVVGLIDTVEKGG